MITRTLVRIAPVASVVICLARADLKSGAVMFLVCLGTTICWRLRPEAAFETLFNLTLLGAAWSATWHLYERWPGWDLVVHFAAIAMLALLATSSVQRWRPGRPIPRWHPVAAGSLLSIIWEIMELAGHYVIDSSIEVGAVDTMSDIIAGVAGATVAACGRHVAAQRQGAT